MLKVQQRADSSPLEELECDMWLKSLVGVSVSPDTKVGELSEVGWFWATPLPQVT